MRSDNRPTLTLMVAKQFPNLFTQGLRCALHYHVESESGNIGSCSVQHFRSIIGYLGGGEDGQNVADKLTMFCFSDKHNVVLNIFTFKDNRDRSSKLQIAESDCRFYQPKFRLTVPPATPLLMSLI